MSIALQRRRSRVHESPEIAAESGWSPAAAPTMPRPPGKAPPVEGDAGPWAVGEGWASCSSSVGRKGDSPGGSAWSDGDESGEPEVQSSLKGPLDTMDALQDSLPFWRGISQLYHGKSRSFTCLAEVSSSPHAPDHAKLGKSYARKRKRLLGFISNQYKHQSSPLRCSIGGSIPKRLANSGSKTSSPLGSSSTSNSNSKEECDLPQLQLLPCPNGKTSHHPPSGTSPLQRYSLPVRSFSSTDLQGATTSGSSMTSM